VSVGFPAVIASGEVVLAWEGLQLGLLSVELWPDVLVVRAAGVAESVEAKEREERHRREHREWVAGVGRAHRESRELPEGPLHPLDEPLSRLQLSVSDDVATSYRWTSNGRGGASWDFSGEWFFAPAPPAGAKELRVTFSIRDGPTGVATVRLKR
jgi:hypothetical protein